MRILNMMTIVVVFMTGGLFAESAKTVEWNGKKPMPLDMSSATYCIFTGNSVAGNMTFNCVTLSDNEIKQLKEFLKKYSDKTPAKDLLEKSKGTNKHVFEDFKSDTVGSINALIKYWESNLQWSAVTKKYNADYRAWIEEDPLQVDQTRMDKMMQEFNTQVRPLREQRINELKAVFAFLSGVSGTAVVDAALIASAPQGVARQVLEAFRGSSVKDLKSQLLN